VFAPFHYAFVQRGVLEILFLSAGAGLLGTWIVLRGLSFYAHAVATAAFPGLVLADGLAFPAPLGALAAALAFAFGVGRLAGDRRRSGYDSLTALVLVGALALGIILASDVFHSGSEVDSLLFGSLLAIGDSDLVLAAVASALAVGVSVVLGRQWLATGFDAASARALGARPAVSDALLLTLVALVVTSALAAIGALLATALYVVPAATARLWVRTVRAWQLASVGLAAAEGVGGLWLSVETNVPPGAAIAVLAGGVFALAAAVRALATRRHTLAVAAVALVLFSGCGSGGGSHPGTLNVVATTTQIGDWVRVIGGRAADVHQILQPNTDPHEYEPRPNEVIATGAAKVVFESGDGLDRWMAEVVSQAGGAPVVVNLGADVPVRLPGASQGAEASRFDPHWWHDPVNAEAAVAAIRDVLGRVDPSHAADFRRNAAAYLVKLRRLDLGIAACFARVPPVERKLVTDHDAFGYFAHRYGISVIGAVIPAQTTEGEPSAGDTAKLIALIRHEHVRAVFPESSLNPSLAKAIARETGATAGYTLYGDTLGPQGSPGATYLGMEQANADAMVRGFTGGRRSCAIAGLR
jgi:ABC-type Zn uptake system ZnuABC Zn-binding protein ZnuA/ABC-type Mn2+/Zn2+ transport system permease subunit